MGDVLPTCILFTLDDSNYVNDQEPSQTFINLVEQHRMIFAIVLL